ncbi:MAG: N-acetylmuramoyl-L-alanine amidase [Rubrivivax sp.]|nr:N-acetylmuramoyl-L-alanine amidase [Rubrivivax sp.]
MRAALPGRRLALRRGGLLALLLVAPRLVRGAGIVAVRVWPARAYSRVTIESDARLSATHQLLSAPARLVVDIDGLELSPTLRELVGKVRPDDPYIAGVRVGQYQPRVVRLVFDLKQPVRTELGVLQPVPPYQHRLLFDLHPAEDIDPLLALVREKEAAAATGPATTSGTTVPNPSPDLLGELIARIDKPAAPGALATDEVPLAVAPALPPAPAIPALASIGPPAGSPPAPASPSRRTQALDRLIIVAIDPGHGGEDPGAIGPTGLREKDVVLALALMLRERLNAEPNLRTMLTRDGDYFVPLGERVRKARRVQADLFVSLHADAFMRREARGASVFALSTRGASSAAARWMAERENASDDVGGVSVGRIQDASLLQAMADMSTAAQIQDSLKLGAEVLGRLGRVGRLHKRQVEQAGFAVLKAPDVPSILVETAFISNPEEEALLRQAAYRRDLVEAIAAGVLRHLQRHPPLPRQRTV